MSGIIFCTQRLDRSRMIHDVRAVHNLWAAFPAMLPIILLHGLASRNMTLLGLTFVLESPAKTIPSAGPSSLGRWLAKTDLNPEDFRSTVGPESKRMTDLVRNSPFAPTNLRMYRQTYWGLRALSNVQNSILPWNPPTEGALMEVLPAHVVAKLCAGGCRYKGRSDEARQGREKLLNILREGKYKLDVESHEEIILEDKEGDALDAILAAIAAHGAYCSGFATGKVDFEQSEGWIYSID